MLTLKLNMHSRLWWQAGVKWLPRVYDESNVYVKCIILGFFFSYVSVLLALR